MKKFISIIAVLCMFMSMTTFAATDAVFTMKALGADDKEITTVKKGDVIKFSFDVTADSHGYGVNAASINLTYDNSLLKIDCVKDDEAADNGIGTLTSQIYEGGNGFQIFDEGYFLISLLRGSATKKYGPANIATFEATVIGESGTISFGKTVGTVTMMGSTAAKKGTANLSVMPTIKIVGDEPAGITEEYPTTGAAGQGLVDKSVDEEGNYDIVAKAPIGKKAVITVDGAVVASGHIYKGKPSTSVKVEFVDDDDYSVITYPIIYKGVIEGTTEGVVVFGKGTIDEGDEYGIKLTKGEKSTKYKAGFNAAGIFGVAFIDGEGEYTAQAYVNDATGRVVSFTK